MNVTELAAQHCIPRKGAEHLIVDAKRDELLHALQGWNVTADAKEIVKDFKFPDFHRTMGFVNALAYMANREDHHPDLDVGYGHCRVHWSTHDVGGLSLNDFICAAKVELLVA